jgi:hypothetical protein
MEQEYILPTEFTHTLVGRCVGEGFRVWLARKLDEVEADESDESED